MGEKMLLYYKYVGDNAGISGKMKLAMETKVPSTAAAMEPDTPDVLKQFKAAVEKITGKPAPSY